MTKIIDFFKASGKGNQQQFEALLRPHVPLIYKKALHWTGNHADAEDLLQDVLVKLTDQIDTMRNIDILPPWLLKVAYRQFVDQYRRQARNPLVNESALASTGPEATDSSSPTELYPDSRDAFAGLELRDELLQALATLSPELRQVIVLIEYKGYTVEEAAAHLKIQPGTVKSRNHRAKEKLKKILKAGTFSSLPSC